MEASDVFAQEPVVGDDPFAESDFADFDPDAEATEPAADAAGADLTAGLPTVNKEGQRIAPPDGASVESQGGQAAQPTPAAPAQAAPAPVEVAQQAEDAEARKAEGAEYAARNAAPERTTEPQVGPTPEAQAALAATREQRERGEAAAAEVPEPLAQQERLRAIAEQRAAEEAAAPDPTQPQAAPAVSEGGTAEQPAQEPASEEEPQPESAGPTEVTPDPTQASPEAPSRGSATPAASESEDAEPPAEDRTPGKKARRRYVVLRADGPGKFTQVHWHEDKDGKMVEKGTPGAKRQTVCLARGAEEALKVGFLACGAPDAGVTLVACAQLHFQPKPVKPKPPEPSRQRLQIG